MTDEPDAYRAGAEVFADVYAGNLTAPPEGAMPFMDVMMKTVFAEVWARDVLTIRERRLLLMGVIAAGGSVDTWKVQATAALDRGELDVAQLRETLVFLAPYAGYPNVAPLVAATEHAIAEWERRDRDGD